MNHKRNCVLLADRHHGLRDSVRGLLETEFDTVFMVATEASLLDGADRLNPAAVVVDLSLSAGDLTGLLDRVTARAPGARVVLKRCLATDLMPAVDAVLAGQRYLSPLIAP
ncbi:MAG TPA: hypothetical protein VEX14_08885 [Burkholderiaceae bacterium]|nr:hypothetical protein [Burkholderiaceae bacterium]